MRVSLYRIVAASLGLCVFVLPALAKEKLSTEVLERVQQSLVQIVPSHEQLKKKLPMGCTGFFFEKKWALDPDSIVKDKRRNYVMTNLSCLVTFVDSSKLRSLGLTNATLIRSDTKKEYKVSQAQVVGVHPLSNIAVISVYNLEEDDPSFLEFASVEPEIGDYVFSARFQSENSSEDSQTSIVVDTAHPDVDEKGSHYLMHEGDGFLHGFQGSPMLNAEGQVVGINSYSNILFFNLGYSLVPLLDRSQEKYNQDILGGLIWSDDHLSSGIQRKAFSELTGSRYGLIHNDAFDQVLGFHPMIQVVSFDAEKILMELLRKTELEPHNLYNQLRTMDIMMDLIYEEYDYAYQKNLHAAQKPQELKNKETRMIFDQMQSFFQNYRFVYKNMRAELISIENGQALQYIHKIQCDFYGYYQRYRMINSEVPPLPSSRREMAISACDEVDQYVPKVIKRSWGKFKNEPYAVATQKEVQQFYVRYK